MMWRCLKMQQGECEAACNERRCGAGCSSHLRRTCDGKTALPGKSPTVSEISNPDYSGTIWRALVRSRKDRLKQIHQHPSTFKSGLPRRCVKNDCFRDLSSLIVVDHSKALT